MTWEDFGTGDRRTGLQVIQDWLYNDPWTKEKLDTFRFAYAFPVARDYLDYLLDSRNDAIYMARYGIDYSDIRDPRKLSATSSTSRLIGSAYRMISRNIDSLYK